MGKVLILNGSPRKKAFTAQTLREIARGVESVGGEAIWWELNDPGIRPCQGCNFCIKHGKCSVRDNLTPMYAQIAECDGIVLGSPNYFFTVTAQTKTWLDRMACLHEGDTPVARYPGKQYITVFTQGNIVEDMFKAGYTMVEESLKGFGWEPLEQIIINGTLDIPNFSLSKEQKERAFNAGTKIGQFKSKPIEEAKKIFIQNLEALGIWDPHGGKSVV